MLSPVNSSEAQHGVYPASKLSNWGLTRDLFGARAADKVKPREDWGGDPKTECMGGGGGGVMLFLAEWVYSYRLFVRFDLLVR